MKIKTLFALIGLVCLVGLGLRADIKFLWLDKPTGRNNPHDPSSPLFVAPTATPLPATATPSGPTATNTTAPTQTPGGPTATNTVPPTNTTGPTNTNTVVPTNTPTVASTPVVVFDNFETSAWTNPVASYMYATWQDTGTTTVQSVTSPLPGNQVGTGTNTTAVQVTHTFPATGGVSEITLNSEYGSGGYGGPVAVTSVGSVGSLALTFEIYSNMPLTLGLYLNNPSQANQVQYVGPTLNVPASAWTTITVPVNATNFGAGVSSLSLTQIQNVIINLDNTATGAMTATIDNVAFIPSAAGPTPTNTAVVPTNTPTNTNTPVGPTATPTTGSASPWPVVVNANTVLVGGNFYGAGGSVGNTEVNGGTASGYENLTLSSAAYIAAGVYSFGYTSSSVAITQNASSSSDGTGSYMSLSISVQIPVLAGVPTPYVIPGVNIVTVSGGVTITSRTVNVENYIPNPNVAAWSGTPGLVEDGTYLVPGKWYTAIIPLTAFEGYNNIPTPGSATLTAATLATAIGVQVQPANYGNTGVIAGSLWIGGIAFTTTVNANAPAAGSNGFSGLYSDFEDGTAAAWGGYWSANVDTFTSSTCPGLVPPPGSGTNCTTCQSSIVYSAVTDTAGTTGSNTPGTDGLLWGWLGTENGQYGTPNCGVGSGDYPFLNMSANVYNVVAPALASINLSNNSVITTLPATGATGLAWDMKVGANCDPSATFGVVIATTQTANTGNVYYVEVQVGSGANDLTTSWKHYNVNFPASGYVSSGTTAGVTYHSGSGGPTELNWNQAQYSDYSSTWGLTDVSQVGVAAYTHGTEAQVYIDNIQFY